MWDLHTDVGSSLKRIAKSLPSPSPSSLGTCLASLSVLFLGRLNSAFEDEQFRGREGRPLPDRQEATDALVAGSERTHLLQTCLQIHCPGALGASSSLSVRWDFGKDFAVAVSWKRRITDQ